MKKTSFLLSCLLVTALGCQQQPVSEALAVQGESAALPPAERIAASKPFVGYPIDYSAFCSGNPNENCAERVQNIQSQLIQLSPVQQLVNNDPTAAEAEAATMQYKQFLSQHSSEPIASVFKQVYGRLLLTEYGLLDGENTALVRYYTHQLLDAKSLDARTIDKAMRKIKDSTPEPEFAQMMTQALAQAEAVNKLEKDSREHLISQVKKSRSEWAKAHKGNLSVDFLRKQEEKQLRALEAQPTVDHVAALRQLQDS